METFTLRGWVKILLIFTSEPSRLICVKNGSLRSEMNFVYGTQEGEMKIYDTSGALWHSIEYKNGKKNGIAKEFDENGKIVREVIYRDDIEISR